MMLTVPFNKPFYTGNEVAYMQQALQFGKLSGDGDFTKRCHTFLEQTYGFNKCLLTTSCTHALEMAAILANIGPGDEVILPSYTFVSTANPFTLRGATLIFADSLPNHPNMDIADVARKISPRTKAIVPVHYAGVACNMEAVMELAHKHDLLVIEDAAQAIHASYKNRPLGTWGHMAAFSFHDTKNIICGEGGMLVINDERFQKRAEIIREKGTNRSAFFRGEVDKYGWVDIGSSYLPSELLAAFLLAQLEAVEPIHKLRHDVWNQYFNKLKPLETSDKVRLPAYVPHTKHNAHIFYLLTDTLQTRTELVNHLKKRGIAAPFHYLSLHKSMYFGPKYQGPELPNSEYYTDCLVRLPLWAGMSTGQVEAVIDGVSSFFTSTS